MTCHCEYEDVWGICLFGSLTHENKWERLQYIQVWKSICGKKSMEITQKNRRAQAPFPVKIHVVQDIPPCRFWSVQQFNTVKHGWTHSWAGLAGSSSQKLSVLRSIAVIDIYRCHSKPICSMYGIFTYIYPKNHPNVGKYSIHGASGKVSWYFLVGNPGLSGESAENGRLEIIGRSSHAHDVAQLRAVFFGR